MFEEAQELKSFYSSLLEDQLQCRKVFELIERINDDNLPFMRQKAQVAKYEKQISELLKKIRSTIGEINLETENQKSSLMYSALKTKADEASKQFSSLQSTYRNLIATMYKRMEHRARKELLANSSGNLNDDDDQDSLSKASQLNDDMKLYCRRLEEQLQLGTKNAEIVLESSEQITANQSELRDMKGNLSASKRLMLKFTRQRVVDSVIYFFAFAFFYLTCAYILMKRVFKL